MVSLISVLQNDRRAMVITDGRYFHIGWNVPVANPAGDEIDRSGKERVDKRTFNVVFINAVCESRLVGSRSSSPSRTALVPQCGLATPTSLRHLRSPMRRRQRSKQRQRPTTLHVA